MATKKQNTAFNVQVADFIRNHKKAGTAIDDEITEKLVIPFVLDADGIDDLLERLTDGGISITDKMEILNLNMLLRHQNQKSLQTRSFLVQTQLKSMTLFVCTSKRLG